jgi:acetyl esterase
VNRSWWNRSGAHGFYGVKPEQPSLIDARGRGQNVYSEGMPLDRQSQAVLDALNRGSLGDYDGVGPEAARARLAGTPPLPPGPDADVRDLRLPGGQGEIAARRYSPAGASGALGALVYAHGGGFVLGGLDGHDNVCRQLAVDARCVVISLDYRLAPEAPFPAAVEDCYAATSHIFEHAANLGIDPMRIAVGGDSAGGNLSAVVCQLARARGGPPLVFQLLVYPATDFRSLDTASYRSNKSGYFLSHAGMAWFRSHYLPSEEDRNHPTASPLAATDLAGLPPALIVTAEYDPLRDDGDAYARALATAGVDVSHLDFDGTIHGFVSFYAFIDKGRIALKEMACALRRAFQE